MRLLTLFIAIALLGLLPRTSRAQFCADNDPCPGNQAPVVSLVGEPATALATYTFAMYASDDGMLQPSSLQLWLNGSLQSSWGQETMAAPWGTYSTGGQLTLASGANTIIVQMCETRSSPLCGADTLTVTYTPPPTPPATAAPVLTLAQRNDGRLLDACATCSTMTTGYAMPSFYLNGAPQSVALRYSSEQANPVGYVEVDAHVWAQTAPTRIGIKLKRDTSFVQLSTGSTEAFVVGGLGTLRLAGWFDAWSYSTGSIDVSVIVTAYYGPVNSPTAIHSDTLENVHVLVHNARLSPYGRGWTVVGDERLVAQANGDLVVSDGGGQMTYYTKVGCGGSPWTCTYTSPAGTLATITRVLVPTGLLDPPDTVWVRDNKNGTTTHWTNTGLLDRHVDSYGNTTTYERMSGGDAARIYRVKLSTAVGATAINKYVTFAYDGDGKLASITLPDSRSSAFSVASGSGGTLQSITDPDGVTALTASYSYGFMMSVAGRSGQPDSISYDSHWQFSGSRGPVVAIEGGTSRDSTHVLSLRTRLLTNNAATASGSPILTAIPADSASMKLSGRNGTTTEVWSATGGGSRLVRTVTSTGKIEERRTTYNSEHLPVAVRTTGQAGTSQDWTAGRLVRTTDIASGLTTEYRYDSGGRIDSILVNDDLVARYFYTGTSFAPDSSRSDTANVTRYTYDSRGRVLTVRDVNNVTVTATYETTHGNVASSTRTGSGVPTTSATFSYDASGRSVSSTDPLGRVFTTSYNSIGRDTLLLGPSSTTTRRSYNDVSGVYSLTDPKSQQYSVRLNAAGLATSQVDPTGAKDSVTYDADGRVMTQRSRRGDFVKYSYDGLGRVITRTHQAPGQSVPDTTSYAYDPENRWVAVRNAESTDTMFVDAAGRPSEAISRQGALRFRVAYGYTDGYLSSRISIHGDSAGSAAWTDTLGVAYDAQRNANVFRDFGGKDTRSLLDKSGRLTVDSLPTSTVPASKIRRTTSYAPGGEVIAQSFTGNPDYQLSRTYGDYDAIGRIGSITRQGSPTAIVRLHQYDALGRLTTYRDRQITAEWEYFQTPWDPWGDCPGCFILDSTLTQDTVVIRSANYTYDLVHNRTDRNDSITTGNRARRVDGWTVTYDTAGNITQRTKASETLTYTWNGLGQLTQVVATFGGTTTYGYDGFGRRIRKTVNGVTTRYVVDGDRVLAETNGSGAPQAMYSYYPGVDRPHAMLRANKRYYFAQDMQGNVIGLIDSVGNVVQTYNYTPYGEAVDDMGVSVVNPYRYKGREWDAEARLYYMRARYYDPMLGRFISDDPIGLDGGINPAVFVEGDPVTYSDPFGLTPCPRVNTTCAWPIAPNVSLGATRMLNQLTILLGGLRPGFVTGLTGNDAHTEDHFRLPGPPGKLEQALARPACRKAAIGLLFSVPLDVLGFGAAKAFLTSIPKLASLTYQGGLAYVRAVGAQSLTHFGAHASFAQTGRSAAKAFGVASQNLDRTILFETLAPLHLNATAQPGVDVLLGEGSITDILKSMALGFIPAGNSINSVMEVIEECI